MYKKIVNTYPIEDLEILTPDGWVDLVNLHETIPYQTYNIKCFDGLYLNCADNHIVIDSLDNEIFVKDLKQGDEIKSKNGVSKIELVEMTVRLS